MPKLSVSLQHGLAPEEALRRIKKLVGETKSQFAGQISDVSERWNGNSGAFALKALGFSVSGQIEVGRGFVQVTGTLPLAALPWRGKIESTLRDRAAALLA